MRLEKEPDMRTGKGRFHALPALVVFLSLLAPAAAQEDTGSGLSTILRTAEHDRYGRYLVTAEGRPLYVLSADTPRSPEGEASSKCLDACMRQWPPLVSGAGAVASPEIDNTLIANAQREDGASQVLFDGHPLYTFAADRPGEAPTGHGRTDPGGVWRLLAPDGAVIAADG
jgi:predicted lipoprotein with Yx(FWY)xxD motif